jgi:hypothetical protein
MNSLRISLGLPLLESDQTARADDTVVNQIRLKIAQLVQSESRARLAAERSQEEAAKSLGRPQTPASFDDSNEAIARSRTISVENSRPSPSDTQSNDMSPKITCPSHQNADAWTDNMRLWHSAMSIMVDLMPDTTSKTLPLAASGHILRLLFEDKSSSGAFKTFRDKYGTNSNG